MKVRGEEMFKAPNKAMIPLTLMAIADYDERGENSIMTKQH